MKTKAFKFSILLTVLFSLLAVCFLPHKKHNIYAADLKANHLLISADNSVYSANETVGSSSGDNKYIIGETEITPVTAKAQPNYMLAGWQVTYLDQNNKVEFFNNSNLVSNSKTVELTSKLGEKISTVLQFEDSNSDGYYEGGSFIPSIIFENIEVSPIYDHVYYNIDINNLVTLSKLPTTYIEVETSKIYYSGTDISTKEEVVGNTKTVIKTTVYLNSIFNENSKYYFYGSVYKDEITITENLGLPNETVTSVVNLYTVHQTIQDQPVTEKIALTKGAFRVGEVANIKMNVNASGDFATSKNIDVVGFNINQKTILNVYNEDTTSDYFKTTADVYKRTTDYEILFNVEYDSSYTNEINIVYHNLFVATINLSIDGTSATSEQIAEIVAAAKINEGRIEGGNIGITNYHSVIDVEKFLQFFVKDSNYTNPAYFSINASRSIIKVVEGIPYTYYTLNSIDGDKVVSRNYTYVRSNINVNIDYSSAFFDVEFKFAEYKNGALKESIGNVLDKDVLKRGESKIYNSIGELKNIGYTFKGFTTSLSEAISNSVSVQVDFVKPVKKVVYLCYEKINYTIQFTNYNQINLLDGTKSLSSVTFATNNEFGSSHEIRSIELTGTTVTVGYNLQIGDTTTITHNLNNGFEILGYSFKSTITSEDDYLTNNSFVLTEELIQSLGGSTTIVVYVYESYLNYNISYYISPTLDTILNEDVIMANISESYTSVKPSDIVVIKYDKDGNITNIATDVTKITISNLKYNDRISLISNPKSVATSATVLKAYTYAFGYFTADHKLHLTKETTENADKVVTEAKHNAFVTKDRDIEVVYSMPNTRITISIEEEFANNPNFSYNLIVKQGGSVIESQENIANNGSTEENVFGGTYIVDPGAVELTVEKIVFGYTFSGYTLAGRFNEVTNAPDAEGVVIFTYEATGGTNDLILNFNRNEYKFTFTQIGGGFENKTDVNFSGNNYTVLTVDNTSIEFNKPVGYYVATVHMGDNVDTYSTILSENNDYRNNNDIVAYKFSLTKDQFLEIVKNENLCKNNTVNVTITYIQFTYTITVDRYLSQDKPYLVYPHMVLEYTTQQGVYQAYSHENRGTIIFSEIPYNANAVINVVTMPQPGVKIVGAGWSGNVSGYSYSYKSINLNTITKDKDFVYELEYVPYEIQIVSTGLGNPQVYVNDIRKTTATLFDELSIIPNASRDAGYKFNKITYINATYTQYTYVAEEWDEVALTLYILKDGTYIKNTSSTYNPNIVYFAASTEIIETNAFEDIVFDVANFIVNDNNKIIINVDFVLLQMQVVNITKQKEGTYSLTNRGNGNSALAISLDDFAEYTIEITDSNGIVVERDTVNFYDTLKITIQINKEALNSVDNNKYDLTKGLYLTSIYINSQYKTFTVLDNGKYEVLFSVGAYMPQVDENIQIEYTYQIGSQTIQVTTIVNGSESEFYRNITMYADAASYGFHESLSGSFDKESMITPEYQHLAKAKVYATFSSLYEQYFFVSGVVVKVDGKEIESKEYIKYGIEQPNENMELVLRLIYDLEIIFKVQPIITYNGGPNFTSTYKCDVNGDGYAQYLSHGASSASNIQISSIFANRLQVNYVPINDYTVSPASSVTNAGVYKVLISFSEDNTSYAWLKDVKIVEIVTLTIEKKDIYLSYNDKSIKKTTQTYNGTSVYEQGVDSVYQYLIVTDNGNLTVSYDMAVDKNRFVLAGMDSYIAQNKEAISEANENIYYDYYIYNISLLDNLNDNQEFNDNFNLRTNSITIAGLVQIKKRELQLEGLKVFSKVYDGSDVAEINSDSNMKLTNIIDGEKDKFSVDITKLSVKFADSSIGINKSVIVNGDNAMVNLNDEKDWTANYYINNASISGLTIYPYELTTTIKNIGTISLINNRGLTEKSMVDLLPVNSYIKVEVIEPDSPEYAQLYRLISNRLKRNNVFAKGYYISLVVNGEEQPIDKNLHISVPKIKDITGVYGLDEKTSSSLNYKTAGQNIIIDLSDGDGKITGVFLTQRRALLKAWQIVLIVVLSLLVVAGVVITVLIIRKKKIERYAMHEKI